MSEVSTQTRKIYRNARRELILLHYRLRLIKQLFIEQDIVDLLNKTSPVFFRTLRSDLLDTIVIGISRLLDPANTLGKPNASLKQLTNSLDPNAHTELISSLRSILVDIESSSGRIKSWRNKFASHRDLRVVEGIDPEPAINILEINEVFELSGKFLNEFEIVCQDQTEEINTYGKPLDEIQEMIEKEDSKEQTNIFPPANYELIVIAVTGSSKNPEDCTQIIDIINKANYAT